MADLVFVAGLLGLAVGSFLNVVVRRVPRAGVPATLINWVQVGVGIGGGPIWRAFPGREVWLDAGFDEVSSSDDDEQSYRIVRSHRNAVAAARFVLPYQLALSAQAVAEAQRELRARTHWAGRWWRLVPVSLFMKP